MRSNLFLSVLILAEATLLASAEAGMGRRLHPAGGQQRSQFRVGVDLVSLSVTVTDPANRFVVGLEREDFSVYEDGVEQEISLFSREELPLRVGLLLDTSASMEPRMSLAQEAAAGFAEALGDEDLAQVVEFSSRVHVLQPYTSDREALARALRMTQAGGTTSLYDALYISLRELATPRDEARRQSLIVLSDGEDTSSLVSLNQVMELARATDVTIYTILLRSGAQSRGKRSSEAEFALKKLAEGTGGAWFFPSRLEDLDGAYDRIGSELRSQYQIGYISSNSERDGSWRRVAVRTTRENATARTRVGYYAPAPKRESGRALEKDTQDEANDNPWSPGRQCPEKSPYQTRNISRTTRFLRVER
jgi:Ca-activated chloride channel family protein